MRACVRACVRVALFTLSKRFQYLTKHELKTRNITESIVPHLYDEACVCVYSHIFSKKFQYFMKNK